MAATGGASVSLFAALVALGSWLVDAPSPPGLGPFAWRGGLLLLASSICGQATWHVNVNAVPPGTGAGAAPFVSIQAAIDVAINGDTVIVAPGTYVEWITFAGKAITVRSSHGRYESDCVVIAIGVVPNTEWLEGSSIERDERGGIVVDAQLQTSLPDVYAAGDCASVRWFDGSRRPEQLWYTARDQGRVAGRALLGEGDGYARGTWYNSAKLMDIEYTTAGLVNWELQGESNWFFEERGAVRSTTRIVTQDERVVGFNLLGRRWDHSVLTRWIEEQRSLPWVLQRLNEGRSVDACTRGIGERKRWLRAVGGTTVPARASAQRASSRWAGRAFIAITSTVVRTTLRN